MDSKRLLRIVICRGFPGHLSRKLYQAPSASAIEFDNQLRSEPCLEIHLREQFCFIGAGNCVDFEEDDAKSMSRAWMEKKTKHIDRDSAQGGDPICAEEQSRYENLNFNIVSDKMPSVSQNRLFGSQPSKRQLLESRSKYQLDSKKASAKSDFCLKMLIYVFNESNLDLSDSAYKTSIRKILEQNSKANKAVKQVLIFSDIKDYLDQIKFLKVHKDSRKSDNIASLDELEDFLSSMYLDHNFEYMFVEKTEAADKLMSIVDCFVKQGRALKVRSS